MFGSRLRELTRENNRLRQRCEMLENRIEAFEGKREKKAFIVCLGSIEDNEKIEIWADEAAGYIGNLDVLIVVITI